MLINEGTNVPKTHIPPPSVAKEHGKVSGEMINITNTIFPLIITTLPYTARRAGANLIYQIDK
ncbi:MAG: hypothetical protein ABIK22_05910 [candidate division WOR-3 bacterium]